MRTIRQSIEKIAPALSRVLINGPRVAVAKNLRHVQFIASQTAAAVSDLLLLIAPAWLASALTRNYLVQKTCKVIAELLGFLNKRIAARFILMKYVICPWKLKEKSYGQLMNRDSGVGGNTEVVVDVRVISASSRDLQNEISEGRLREDLYYRLGVVPLSMPSLADRREDIPVLAKYFTNRIAKRIGVQPIKLSDEILLRWRAMTGRGM